MMYSMVNLDKRRDFGQKNVEVRELVGYEGCSVG